MQEHDELVSFEDLPIWCTVPEVCHFCGKRSVLVYPITAERLQCECGKWNPAPSLPHEPSKRDLGV